MFEITSSTDLRIEKRSRSSSIDHVPRRDMASSPGEVHCRVVNSRFLTISAAGSCSPRMLILLVQSRAFATRVHRLGVARRRIWIFPGFSSCAFVSSHLFHDFLSPTLLLASRCLSMCLVEGLWNFRVGKERGFLRKWTFSFFFLTKKQNWNFCWNKFFLLMRKSRNWLLMIIV